MMKAFQPNILQGRILSTDDTLPLLSSYKSKKAMLETPILKTSIPDLVPKSWQRLMADFKEYGFIHTISDTDELGNLVSISIWAKYVDGRQAPYKENMIATINEIWTNDAIFYWDVYGDVLAIPDEYISQETFKKKMIEAYYRYRQIPMEKRVQYYKISRAFGYSVS